MEEITNKKGVPAAAVVGITILAAIIFGAGAYMYANNQAAQEKDALNAQIVTLQNEVLSAKKVATTTSNPSTPAANNTGDKVASTEKPSIPSDWKTYKNDKYGYEVKYSGTLELLDRDNDRIYVSNAQIVDSEGNLITTRVLSKSNLPSCADKTLTGQVKCFYMALEQNANRISQQKFGDNTFVYADFTTVGETVTNSAVNMKDLMAFTEKGDYIYQFEIIDPTSTASEDLFKNILSTFKFSS